MPCEKISLLSLPTSEVKNFRCEICGAQANQSGPAYRCTDCGSAYCSKMHYDEDIHSVHRLLCPLLQRLRQADLTAPANQSGQSPRAHILSDIVRVARTEAQRALSRQQYAESVPAARHALRFGAELYGPTSVQLARPRLLLGEAAMGLGKLEEAERHIALARALVLQVQDHRVALSAADVQAAGELTGQLHQQAVKLFLCLERVEAAQREVALDGYHTAVAVGPSAAAAAPAAHLLGAVLERAGDMAAAHRAHLRVLVVWWQHFERLGLAARELPPTGRRCAPGSQKLVFERDPAAVAVGADIAVEMQEILPRIFAVFRDADPVGRDAALAATCCALFGRSQGTVEQALEYAKLAEQTLCGPSGLCETGPGVSEAEADGLYGAEAGPAPYALLHTVRTTITALEDICEAETGPS